MSLSHISIPDTEWTGQNSHCARELQMNVRRRRPRPQRCFCPNRNYNNQTFRNLHRGFAVESPSPPPPSYWRTTTTTTHELWSMYVESVPEFIQRNPLDCHLGKSKSQRTRDLNWHWTWVYGLNCWSGNGFNPRGKWSRVLMPSSRRHTKDLARHRTNERRRTLLSLKIEAHRRRGKSWK